tara:strand:- start:227 stop:1012 length:786 start_codon:yes stop_codon:yes gene_type:complete
MSTLTSYNLGNRPSASSNSGLCIFRSDTDAIEVSDGTNWQTYNSDGVYQTFSSNSYSGVFDGAGDWISIGTIAALNSASTFSYSAWFKLSATPSLETLFGGGSSTSNRLWTQVYTSTQFRIGMGGTIKDLTVSTFNTTDWYHFAYAYNAGTVNCYLNGSSVGTLTGFPSTTNSNSSTNLRLGALTGDAAFNNNTLEFQGKMDEIAFFNYELSGSQVSSIYNDKTYSLPTALWRLENDVTDEIGSFNGVNSNVTFDSSDKPY